MSDPLQVISVSTLHELWGMGFTLVPRQQHPDPFEVPAWLVPHGMSYQWVPIKPDEGLKAAYEGWMPVPHSTHPGFFAPYATQGDIEIMGMVLSEKPKEVVSRARAAAEAKARKQVDDWAQGLAESGITGGARVVSFDGDKAIVTKVEAGKSAETYVDVLHRPREKTIELISQVPTDMVPHMAKVFAERDRIRGEVVRKNRTLVPGEIADKFYAAIDADKTAMWWPTLNAIILPYAIEAVRKKLKEKSDEQHGL